MNFRLSAIMGSLTTCVLVLAGPAFAEEKSATATSPGEAPFTIQFVDPSGNPLDGAKAGNGREQWDSPFGFERHWTGTLVRWTLGGRRGPPAVSDEHGKVVLPYKTLFPSGRGLLAVYAWHEATGLVGLHMITSDDPKRELRMELQPACRVFGQMDSGDLKDERIPIDATYANLSWGESKMLLSHSSTEARFEFLLPPGNYELRLGGDGLGIRDSSSLSGGAPLEEQRKPFAIEKGQTSLNLGKVDLKLTPLGRLVGKPAPELQGIIGWKNTKPLKLADLKGKVVVLDFWGFWCGPCVGSMPFLFEEYDRYLKDGLVVIAVHDNQARSIEEMEEKLTSVRANLWKGRDLPFPVALDSGEGHGATHKAYHIPGWPTTVLIDRNGRVAHVGDMNWDVIEKALGIEKR